MAFPKINHLLLPLLATITIFLALFSKSISATNNFTEFTFDGFDKSSESKLILQGNATISSTTKTVQLTATDDSGNPIKNSVGRVLYACPVHFWDNSAGYTQVASFETTIKFVITSPTREIAGDGLTFFIAPVGSTIPENSDGGFLGLFQNNTVGTSSVENANAAYQTLFVEFDNYVDGRWDPNYKHIGINVNTVRSRATIPWSRISGEEFTAKINYNTNNKILYVSGSHLSDVEDYSVSASIDLPAVLPKWAWVGLSASTGDSAVERHQINYWYFSAWLHNVSSLTTKENIKHAPLYSA